MVHIPWQAAALLNEAADRITELEATIDGMQNELPDQHHRITELEAALMVVARRLATNGGEYAMISGTLVPDVLQQMYDEHEEHTERVM